MAAAMDFVLYIAILTCFFGIPAILIGLIMKIPFVSRRINAWLDKLPEMDDD